MWSGVGAGTEIELSIPGSIAYGTSPGRAVLRLFRKRKDQIMSGDPRLIRVLSVDDHPLLREGIAALVAQSIGHETGRGGLQRTEAIEKFRMHRPDVTLMDLQMPEMNGIEAMIAIRGEFPEARIIVLTTYTGDVQVLRALKAVRGLNTEGTGAQGTPRHHPCGPCRPKANPSEVAAELAEHATETT